MLKAEISRAISRVFDSGIFIGGAETEAFEAEFSAWVSAGHAVSVACGFDAITLSLMALGIGRGDEVITSANGCPATPLSIAAAGATPVFVDCDEGYVIDPEAVERVVTSRTRAILPVHLYGLPVNMTAIMKVARKRRLKVVEDCAQAHGAEWNGKKVGTFGDAGCFSFYPTKNLGAIGDAGMVVTSSADLAKKVRQIAIYGESRRFDSRILGLNSRMDPIQAAVLRVKLKHLDRFISRRVEIANRYIGALKDTPLIMPDHLTCRGTSARWGQPAGRYAPHLFVIQTPARDLLRKRLKEAGIGSDVHYPIPCHLLQAFRNLGYKRGDFPRAEKFSKRILSLPIYPELKDEEVDRVIRVIRDTIS